METKLLFSWLLKTTSAGLWLLPLHGNAQPANSCVFDPTRDECALFSLSDAQIGAMLADVCREQPQIPACSVARLCQASAPTIAPSPPPASTPALPCDPFALLSSACTSSSSLLRGCRTFVYLCRPKSVVRQCAATLPLPGLNEVLDLIENVCLISNDTEKCSQCSEEPPCRDPLFIYTSLCIPSIYKTLPFCATATVLCNTTSLTSLPTFSTNCPPPENTTNPVTPPPPYARAFLHSEFKNDRFLFDWAIPQTTTEIFVAMTLALFLGLIYEYISALGRSWDSALNYEPVPIYVNLVEENINQQERSNTINTITAHIQACAAILRHKVATRGPRSAVKAIEGVLLVTLVLVVASFNVWLCMSLVLGVAGGAFLCGGIVRDPLSI